MRTIICPICSKDDHSMVFRSTLPTNFNETKPIPPYSAHYQINKCNICGLTYSSPIMNEPGVAKLYEESSETNVLPGEEDNVRRTMALYYQLASPHLRARNRILDVGCDMGFMLSTASADGFKELYGLEPVTVARQVANTIPGAVISEKFFEDTDYPSEFFDLITLIHVLDHLYDPRVVLHRAIENLQPGGVVVAVVHNVDSLLRMLLGERFPIFNLYHHYFFNKRTLAELFRRNGYEVVDVRSTYNCYSLGFFARRVPLLPKFGQQLAHRALDTIGLAAFPVTIPVGNIGIVARRPMK
jgi:2-polyprenyl-3-methyl-5-hydroxy-6-metoxy-1,4-benzoquinol methylase